MVPRYVSICRNVPMVHRTSRVCCGYAHHAAPNLTPRRRKARDLWLNVLALPGRGAAKTEKKKAVVLGFVLDPTLRDAFFEACSSVVCTDRVKSQTKWCTRKQFVDVYGDSEAEEMEAQGLVEVRQSEVNPQRLEYRVVQKSESQITDRANKVEVRAVQECNEHYDNIHARMKAVHLNPAGAPLQALSMRHRAQGLQTNDRQTVRRHEQSVHSDSRSASRGVHRRRSRSRGTARGSARVSVRDDRRYTDPGSARGGVDNRAHISGMPPPPSEAAASHCTHISEITKEDLPDVAEAKSKCTQMLQHMGVVELALMEKVRAAKADKNIAPRVHQKGGACLDQLVHARQLILAKMGDPRAKLVHLQTAVLGAAKAVRKAETAVAETKATLETTF